MNSKRTLGLTCGIVAIVAFVLLICVIVAACLFLYLGDSKTISQVFIAPTSTHLPTNTPSPTSTSTPLPPTPSLPTNTPVPTYTPAATSTPVVNQPSPTPTSSPTVLPTETPVPTDTPLPTNTSVPAPSATPAPPATDTPVPAPPDEPFLPIGTKVDLSPQGSGVTGSAVLFSARELTMINFNYDGKCPITDIRLAMEGFPKPPVAVLLYIETRPFNNESFTLPIPEDLPAGSANALFVYCDSRDEMLAWGPLIPPAY